jgi:hypothetical protein
VRCLQAVERNQSRVLVGFDYRLLDWLVRLSPELALWDATGQLQPLLELSVAQQAENQARTDGRRLRLIPTGGFAHEGKGYLFFLPYAHARVAAVG